jgi:superfamily II DNA/RNA helicase|tara:strand:- start:4598 stop:5209 length:612 start_codon:yes stop_codon:yes gene_type:complete
MPFKKLKPLLKDILEHHNITEATPFQKKAIPKIKSGANVWAVAPDGSGKTTAIIISTLQKLKDYEEHDNPRVIIFVKDKAAALELEAKFEPYIKHMNLTSYSVYDEQLVQAQKDIIYEGVDIVIGTARRINKLYLMNGINLNDMTTVIIEDANFLPRIDFAKDIVRISEAFEKCQYVVFSNVYDEKLKLLKNSFMYNGVLVQE